MKNTVTLLGAACLCVGAASAQDVQVTQVRGADGCPELRVQNNGKRGVDVEVEYSSIDQTRNDKKRGGTRQAVLDDVPSGGRASTYGTYTFTVDCDRPYQFTHRVISVRPR